MLAAVSDTKSICAAPTCHANSRNALRSVFFAPQSHFFRQNSATIQVMCFEPKLLEMKVLSTQCSVSGLNTLTEH